MKLIVKIGLATLGLFVLLLSSSLTACGQTTGQYKIVYRLNENSRLVADTVRSPQRITWLGEKGVFLNSEQEYLTLEKLEWKELYRQDAVAMYWVNLALEERIRQVQDYNRSLEDRLLESQTTAARAVSNMEHYKTLFAQTEATNTELRDKNANLKTQLIVYKGVTITAGIIVVYAVVSNVIK